MDLDFIKSEIEKIVDAPVLMNEKMSAHTTFRIGGEADLFVTPSIKELPKLMRFLKENSIQTTVLGNGSNCLVSDKGIRGVVVCLCGSRINAISVKDDEIEVEAGAFLSSVAAKAYENSLTGFEFAAGIPGTLGGACIMNAGAYGGEMKDVLLSVEVLTKAGEFKTLEAKELDLSYRHSRMMDNGDIVLSAKLKLRLGNKEEIKAVMEDLREKRISKQPLEFPSAGSTFKRPEGYFAGKLIEDAGLRGFSVGGAKVSEKHCGFVVNKGNATAEDVYKLMEEVSRIVEDKFGVKLEPEVRLLGEF